MTGLLADPVSAALERAGIAYRWVLTPSQRQLSLIQSGRGPDCGLGWFRNPEREALGKFTRAIYQDRPFMALTQRDGGVALNQSLDSLLGSGGHAVLLVKDGYSYGPMLDALIARRPSAVQRTAAESVQMVRMIDAGRAGWMLVAPEEADALLQQVPDVAPRMGLFTVAGMPEGNTRHLYCSRAVSDALIAQINRALENRR